MDGDLDCKIKMSGPTLTYVSTGHGTWLRENDTVIWCHWPSSSMEQLHTQEYVILLNTTELASSADKIKVLWYCPFPAGVI